MAEPIAKK